MMEPGSMGLSRWESRLEYEQMRKMTPSGESNRFGRTLFYTRKPNSPLLVKVNSNISMWADRLAFQHKVDTYTYESIQSRRHTSQMCAADANAVGTSHSERPKGTFSWHWLGIFLGSVLG